MKKFFVLLTALFAVLVSSCSYDDSALSNDLNALKNKVENLENRVDEQQVLLNALANQLTIVSVETTADGYVITFSDNSTLTVNHGKDGANGEDGKDGAVVAVEWDEDCAIFTLADGTTLVIPLDNGELPDQPADPENPDVPVDPENPDVPVDPENPEEYSALFLTADKESAQVDEVITFSVTDQDGNDVTSKATIYDQDMTPYKSGKFTATKTGRFEFFAILGTETSNYLKIIVVAEMPTLPADPQPSSVKFNHRPLVVDITGVNCPTCPYAMDELVDLEESEWHGKYNEVTCHAGSYASGDPAASSAASALHNFYGSNIGGYPTIMVNLYTTTADYGMSSIKKALTSCYKKDGADIGISMAVTGDPNTVYCAASVKAAVSKEYKVTAWLLESNISSPKQKGGSKPYHFIYNNALRNMAHNYSESNVHGESIGVLAEGETKELAFELGVTSTKWNFENMSVVVVVSAKDDNDRWEVVNSACCPLNESKPFEYL